MKNTPISTDRDDLLGQVVDEFFEAVAIGKKPDISEYLERYPEIADLLKVAIPAMLAAEDAALEPKDLPLPDSHETTKQLGDFRILRQIGRGGMGIVYEAEQISMKRRVALKVLPLAGLIDGAAIRRFQNEVRAVAALNHPNIVPVYMVGEERGVHYFAMQLILGRSLSEVISSLRAVRDEGHQFNGSSISQVTSRGKSSDRGNSECEPATDSIGSAGRRKGEVEEALETSIAAQSSTIPHSSRREYYRSVVALGIQAATALQHAHDEGIIHRDIKPANLLLDGKAKLYLTDFGLARIESDAGVTMTGDLIGTLRYMAPEQALAKRVVVDHRADIYGLAVTLYELLTLRPAYLAEDRQQLLSQIAFEEPTKLRRIDPDIPPELETIIHKAMSKSMRQRYASAQELADDLRAHLDNRPIKAKPPTTSEIVLKWTRRNPAITWATIVTLTLTTILLGASTVLISKQLKRTSAAEQEATAISKQLAKRTGELERHNYLLQLSDADSAFLKKRYLLARLKLDACPQEQRGREWNYHAQRLQDKFPFTPSGGYPRLTRDGKRLYTISAGKDGQDTQVTAWNLSSGQVIQEINCGVPLNALHVSSDGSWIAVSQKNSGRIVVLQTQTETELWRIPAGGDRTHAIHPIGFSPDDQILVCRSADQRQIIAFNASDGSERRRFGEYEGDLLGSVNISPNGRWLVCDGEDTARIIDMESGNVVAKISQPDGTLTTTFDRTGTRMATCDRNGVIYIWDWDGKRLRKMDSWRASSQQPHHIQFSADGTRLVAVFKDSTVSVWDVVTRKQLAKLNARGPTYDVRFCSYGSDRSADNGILMGILTEGITLWAWENDEWGLRTQALEGAVEATFSPDGRFILASTPMYFAGGMRYYTTNPYYAPEPAAILDAESGETTVTIDEPVYAASWSPDATEIVATPAASKTIRTYDAKTGQQSARQFPGHTGPFTISVVSPQSRQLVSFSSDSTIRRFDFDSGRLVQGPFSLRNPTRRQGPYMGTSVDFSTDGSLLESTGSIRDTRTGDQVCRAYMKGYPYGHWTKRAVFSNDNTSMFSGCAGGLLIHVEANKTGRLKTRFDGLVGHVLGIALSPDEQHVVAGDSDGQVIIWDVASGRPLITLTDSGPAITSLEWSPTGHRIAAGKVDGTVQIWTLPTDN
ncbi:MAG: protein kinase [Planctomycetales bacterium]|nr:protein kinase [Planctomycetales bacterium]